MFYLFLLLFLVVGACSFDDDSEFFPVTSQAFFLSTSEVGEDRKFIQLEGDMVEENAAIQWGLSQERIGDFALDESLLWISDTGQKRLLKIDLEDSNVEEEVSLGELTPHFIQTGDRHILISDTLSRRLGFLHKRRLDLVVRDLEEKPKISAYRSGKFYLQLGDSSVSIYQEQSFSETDRFLLEGPISSIQVDPTSTFTYVYFQGTDLKGGRIDFNTNGFADFSVPSGVEKIIHSTIDTPRFGKESTGLATLFTDGTFRLEELTLGQVEDASIDFFDNQIYIVRSGVWIKRDIPSGEEKELGTFTGKFCRSAFYREFIGN